MPNEIKKPRIALIIDHLTTMGGAEQVFLYMMQAFPEADAYTFAFTPDQTWPELAALPIRTHWAGQLVKSHFMFRLAFPLVTLFMRLWRLGSYDIIFSASASSAKYLPRQGAWHLCYCFIPTRAIWQEKLYFGKNKSGIAAKIFHIVLPFLKKIDLAAAQRVDQFIAVSEHTRAAIRKIYHRESEVVFSPIPVEKFQKGLGERKHDFFLIVSRLDQWKRVDYAIDAFTRLNLPLIVVGEGTERQKLEAMAGPNVRFLGRVQIDEITRLYGQARAVVFTPFIEYGLVPIEAVAAGTPVIALDCPGVRETMTTLGADSTYPNAILFSEQSAESLIEAVLKFETLSIDRKILSQHAEKFGIAEFQARLRNILESGWKSYVR